MLTPSGAISTPSWTAESRQLPGIPTASISSLPSAASSIAWPWGASPWRLGYEAVTTALNTVIQTALYCPQPDGATGFNLTFELLVGCDGLVSSIQTVDDDGAPEPYVACVIEVIQKADFPAHDLPEGMSVTYRVNVAG